MAADGSVQQHTLGSMQHSSCLTLLHAIAPCLSSEEAEEAVKQCKGVPLLVCRAGDALRTGQIIVQVSVLCFACHLIELQLHSQAVNSIVIT